MVDKMGDLLQEQYALGQVKTEAELKALQSQINPHFLYNTLDMINWMAQKDETDNIRNVVQAINHYLIPKITLQPFLENAIVHGINEKEDARGIVMLNGWVEDGRITLSVTDDGTGMREEDKAKPHTGSHYGMDNIAQRLELFFGEKIPIQVESSPGVGTCIVINIPAREEQEEAKP